MAEYNYKTKADREETVKLLSNKAKTARQPYDKIWATCYNYYDGIQQKWDELAEGIDKIEYFQKHAVLTEPYIQVESQINPNVPEPEFYARDNETDKDKVKQRKYVVDYVLSLNDIKGQNTAAERNIKICGNSIYKVYYNAQIDDISIDLINTDDLFPDPMARTLGQCEYVDYIYYMHKRKFAREYKEEIKKAELDSNDFTINNTASTQTFSNISDCKEDEVQILEHWYKDDDGDIACSVMVGGVEIKHIPKYWVNTGRQNKLYPFVHIYETKDIRKFWSPPQLETIIPLIDEMNEILEAGIENIKLMSAGKWVAEEDSLSDETELTDERGQVVWYKAGKQPPRRDEGLKLLTGTIENINFLQEKIERTLRNYDISVGKEPVRTTTAAGLAQLGAAAKEQTNVKEYDKKQGFKRMFELIDWSGLEFYNDDKMIFIGVPEYENKQGALSNLDPKSGDIFFKYNSNDIKKAEYIKDDNGQTVTDKDGKPLIDYYYPRVDCDIHASNGLDKSKNFTVQVLQSLIETPITPENYKIVVKLIDELEIPQTDEIINEITERFEMPEYLQTLNQVISEMPKEQKGALNANPELVFQIAGNLLKQLKNPQEQRKNPNI